MWRELLADFYDVAAYQAWLDSVDSVQIDYVAPELDENSVAPQALLIAGWLASRLGWTLANEPAAGVRDQALTFKFRKGARGSSPTVMEGLRDGGIQLTLNRVERGEHKPGRLVQVELRSGHEG